MKRIVLPSAGPGEGRAKVSSCQITVKHKPSAAFLRKLKTRRNPSFSADSARAEDVPSAGSGRPDGASESYLCSEGPPAYEEPPTLLKLPRLRTFLENANALKTQNIPLEQIDTGAPRTARPPSQPKMPLGRSYYEELQARRRRK